MENKEMKQKNEIDDLGMKELFERFKNEVLADLPSEQAKETATDDFIYAFAKI